VSQSCLSEGQLSENWLSGNLTVNRRTVTRRRRIRHRADHWNERSSIAHWSIVHWSDARRSSGRRSNAHRKSDRCLSVLLCSQRRLGVNHPSGRCQNENRHSAGAHLHGRRHQFVRPMANGDHLADRLRALRLELTPNAGRGPPATSPIRIALDPYFLIRCPTDGHRGRQRKAAQRRAAQWTFDRARPGGSRQTRPAHRWTDRSVRVRSTRDWQTHVRSCYAHSSAGPNQNCLNQNCLNASRLSSTRQLPPMISTNQTQAPHPSSRSLVTRTPTSRRCKYKQQRRALSYAVRTRIRTDATYEETRHRLRRTSHANNLAYKQR
jgi:hypothetical protein